MSICLEDHSALTNGGAQLTDFLMSMGCNLSVCILFILSSCDLNVGPPLPERYAKKYLTEHGFDINVVTAVLEYKEMDRSTILELLDVPDVSVRYMLGRNRHLNREQRSVLWKDRDEFVRKGVAMNPSLTQREIFDAMEDSSPVRHSLAMNPMVTRDVLIKLRSHYRVRLSAFAQNPSCPEAIINEIEKHGMAQDKQLLAISRRRRMEVMKLPSRVDPDGGYYWGQAGAPWLWSGSTNWVSQK